MFEPITVPVNIPATEIGAFQDCLDKPLKCMCGKDKLFRDVQGFWANNKDGEPTWFAICTRSCATMHFYYGRQC